MYAYSITNICDLIASKKFDINNLEAVISGTKFQTISQMRDYILYYGCDRNLPKEYHFLFNHENLKVLDEIIDRNIPIYQPRMVDDELAPKLYETGIFNKKLFYTTEVLNQCRLG